MWTLCVIAAFSLVFQSFCRGLTITGVQGEDTVLQWTLNPMTTSSVYVAVLHPTIVVDPKGEDDYASLYAALGTSVIISNSSPGRRVINTDNTDTGTGHIEFTLTGLTLEDAGDYRARYDLGTGALYPVGVTLVIYVIPTRPTITEENPPVVGSVVVLKCSTTSNSKPDGHGLQVNYKWYINDANLPFDSDKYNASGQYLQVKDIQKTDKSTVVKCLAYENISMLSDVSDGYSILPKYGPDSALLNNTESHELVENRDTFGPISCRADCEPDCEYQWKFNGADIGSQNGVVTINMVNRTSAGTYWCIASNVYGTRTSSRVTLVMYYGPDTPKLTKAIQGDIMEHQPISLFCTTDSVPLPDISIISREDDGKTKVAQGSLNNTLILQKAECLDTGEYICDALNKIGRSSSDPVMINVMCFPRPDNRVTIKKDIYIGNDESLNILVSVIANPAPAMSWTFSINKTYNTTLKNNVNGFIVYENVKHVTYTSHVFKSTVEKGDYGRYSLRAANQLGDTVMSFNVIAKEPLNIESVTSASVVGGAVGGSLAFIIIILIVIVILQHKCRKQEKEENQHSNSHTTNIGARNVLQPDQTNTYESLTERTEEERIGNVYDHVTGHAVNEYMNSGADPNMTSSQGNIQNDIAKNFINEYMNISANVKA